MLTNNLNNLKGIKVQTNIIMNASPCTSNHVKMIRFSSVHCVKLHIFRFWQMISVEFSHQYTLVWIHLLKLIEVK